MGRLRRSRFAIFVGGPCSATEQHLSRYARKSRNAIPCAARLPRRCVKLFRRERLSRDQSDARDTLVFQDRNCQRAWPPPEVPEAASVRESISESQVERKGRRRLTRDQQSSREDRNNFRGWSRA